MVAVFERYRISWVFDAWRGTVTDSIAPSDGIAGGPGFAPLLRGLPTVLWSNCLDDRHRRRDHPGHVRKIRGNDQSIALLGQVAEFVDVLFRYPRIYRIHPAFRVDGHRDFAIPFAAASLRARSPQPSC